MSFNLEEFISDFVGDTWRYEKYATKIPETLTLVEVVDKIVERGLEEKVMASYSPGEFKWRWPDGLLLLKEDGKYVTFVGDKGIAVWVEKFPTFREACMLHLDSVFNSLMYTPPDSVIAKQSRI